MSSTLSLDRSVIRGTGASSREPNYSMVNECVGSDFGFVTSTGLLKHLATERLLLPFELAPVDSLNISNSTPPYVLESPKLPCISFSYERSFSALKAAALLHLTIQLRALEVGVPLPMPRPTIFRFKGPADVY